MTLSKDTLVLCAERNFSKDFTERSVSLTLSHTVWQGLSFLGPRMEGEVGGRAVVGQNPWGWMLAS